MRYLRQERLRWMRKRAKQAEMKLTFAILLCYLSLAIVAINAQYEDENELVVEPQPSETDESDPSNGEDVGGGNDINNGDSAGESDGSLPCYAYHTSEQVAQYCRPKIDNVAVASSTEIQVNDTCQDNQEYCYDVSSWAGFMSEQEDPSGDLDTALCYRCDSTRHSPRMMIDLNNPDPKEKRVTWWQSQSLFEVAKAYDNPANAELPDYTVNIEIDFKKTFLISYIAVTFAAPRPESFSIYKRRSASSDWEPFVFYSESCSDTYGLPPVRRDDPRPTVSAVCINTYSDHGQVHGDKVVFAPITDYDLDELATDVNDTLRNWVTAQSIRIVLRRLWTYGEILYDEAMLKKYYYAIRDVSIGGVCECNGHASSCVYDGERVNCRCEHATDGQNCERCASSHDDVPWQRSTQSQTFVCKQCLCNGKSEQCVFDPALYQASKGISGGRCVNCRDFTAGPHCEDCVSGYYKNVRGDCVPCNCSTTGTVDGSDQCDSRTGQCPCKATLGGRQCRACKSGYWKLDSARGECTQCRCNKQGTLPIARSSVAYDSDPDRYLRVGNGNGNGNSNVSSDTGLRCSPSTGDCRCKTNVEGKRCDRCKKGFFLLDETNPNGCQACFCNLRGDSCNADTNFVIQSADQPLTVSDSGSINADEEWTIVEIDKSRLINRVRPERVFDDSSRSFLLRVPRTLFEQARQRNTKLFYEVPRKLLGNWVNKYRLTMDLELQFWIANASEARDFPAPNILQLISLSIGDDVVLASGNEQPGTNRQLEFWIARYIDQSPGWDVGYSTAPRPSLNGAVLIRTNFTYRLSEDETVQGCWHPKETSSLNFQLALQNVTALRFRAVLEHSYKPALSVDIRRLTLQSVRPKRSDETGAGTADGFREACNCHVGYDGPQCDRCAAGYRRVASSRGQLITCVPCECNNRSRTCDELTGRCDCEQNTDGDNCERCKRGYYDVARAGEPMQCSKCPCPADLPCVRLAEGNTICSECPMFRTGRECEFCVDGYYRDPASADACLQCDCNGNAEQNALSPCDRETGVCVCGFNTTGSRCTECLPGFFGDAMSKTCAPCGCNSLATLPVTIDRVTRLATCDATGRCKCQRNVIGAKCDQCAPGSFNLTKNGCQRCDCDERYTLNGDTSCHNATGQCRCSYGMTGRTCSEPQIGFIPGNPALPCNCSNNGSTSLGCQPSGKCSCKPFFEGAKCERCVENYYFNTSNPTACTPCGGCYDAVQRRVDILRKDVANYEDWLRRQVEEAQLAESLREEYRRFNASLNEFKLRVDRISSTINNEQVEASLNTSLKQLEGLRRTFDDLFAMLSTASDQVSSSTTTLRQSRTLLENTAYNLQLISSRLDELDELLTGLENRNSQKTETANRNLQKLAVEIEQVTASFSTVLAELTGLTENWQQKVENAQYISTLRQNVSNAADRVAIQSDRISNLRAGVNQLNDSVISVSAGVTDANNMLNSLRQRIKQLKAPEQVEINRTMNEFVDQVDSFLRQIVNLTATNRQLLDRFTLFSLENLVTDNLITINDANRTVADLLRELEQDAMQAERFVSEINRLVTQANITLVTLRTLSANLTTTSSTQFAQQFDAVEADLRNIQNSLTVYSSNLSSTNARLTQLQQNVTNLSEKYTSMLSFWAVLEKSASAQNKAGESTLAQAASVQNDLMIIRYESGGIFELQANVTKLYDVVKEMTAQNARDSAQIGKLSEMMNNIEWLIGQFQNNAPIEGLWDSVINLLTTANATMFDQSEALVANMTKFADGQRTALSLLKNDELKLRQDYEALLLNVETLETNNRALPCRITSQQGVYPPLTMPPTRSTSMTTRGTWPTRSAKTTSTTRRTRTTTAEATTTPRTTTPTTTQQPVTPSRRTRSRSTTQAATTTTRSGVTTDSGIAIGAEGANVDQIEKELAVTANTRVFTRAPEQTLYTFAEEITTEFDWNKRR